MTFQERKPFSTSYRIIPNLAFVAATLILFLLLWQAVILVFSPPRYLFPSPAGVFEVFQTQSWYLAKNAGITFIEMILGLFWGVLAGALVALFLARYRLAQRTIMPIVITTQTLPVFAIAPLLVIWFGFGMASKVIMAALIIFFPIASTFHDGLSKTPRHYLDLAHIWGASPGQAMVSIRLPAALPHFASGLKIAATLAPIGAVVGEWVGAAGGLGFVIIQANARTQTPTVFAALILLALGAFIFRAIIVTLTDRFIFWQGK